MAKKQVNFIPAPKVKRYTRRIVQGEIEGQELDFSNVDEYDPGSAKGEAREKWGVDDVVVGSKFMVAGSEALGRPVIEFVDVQEKRNEKPGKMVLDDKGFWAWSKELKHIKKCADKLRISDIALLNCVLVEIGSLIDPKYVLPDLTGAVNGGYASLNLYLAVCARSGAGKGRASKWAKEVWGGLDNVKRVKKGSAEGILNHFGREEVGLDKVRRFVRGVVKGCVMCIDEGKLLGVIGGRNGSSLFEVMKELWDGSTKAGFENKNDGVEGRELDPYTYRFNAIVNLTWRNTSVVLDEKEGGFAQRWVWADAESGLTVAEVLSIPDEELLLRGVGAVVNKFEWVLKYPAETKEEIEADRDVICIAIADAVQIEIMRDYMLKGARDAVGIDELDSHSNQLREILAVLLGFMHGEPVLTVGYWELAGWLMGESRKCRGKALAEMKKLEAEELKVMGVKGAKVKVAGLNEEERIRKARMERQVKLDQIMERLIKLSKANQRVVMMERADAGLGLGGSGLEAGQRIDGLDWVGGADIKRKCPRFRGMITGLIKLLVKEGLVEMEDMKDRFGEVTGFKVRVMNNEAGKKWSEKIDG